MKWTLGLLGALLAAGAAAPTSSPGTSTSVNMSEESSSEPITIPTTTQNIFGDVVSVTPPDAESIELKHLNDDTRFYPDYNGKDPVDDHFTGSPNPSRPKRQSLDYTDMTYEMYDDGTFDSRKRRDVGEPYRIDLEIPEDSDSSSDEETTRPTSDPDSVSTQITYVIISEDDDDDVVAAMKSDPEEHTTEVIDLVMPSIDDSSSSTDSVAERNRVLGAIARTIRAKVRRSSDTDGSSSSSIQLLTRKRRQIPYYRLPDVLNYRIGRSASDPDSDDTEPDDNQGPDEKDLSIDNTDLNGRVVPLPEFAYEFSELTRPASTYVDGQLRSQYVRKRQERGLVEEMTTEPSVDVVTASYPHGIDDTKENLSLPEGNFLGPRVYAKGELIQEEEPSATEIVPPMKKVESIPVEDGTQVDNVYSAPVSNMNLPLIIPVVAPTSHPGDETRIELSVPSGYVPYIIQLSPTNKTSQGTVDKESQTNSHEETTTETMVATSATPQVPTYLSSVPTIIVTPSTPSGNEYPDQTNNFLNTGQSSEDGSSQSSTTASWEPVENSTAFEESLKLSKPSKQKRAEWKSISSAPIGETVEPRSQPDIVSNSPSSGIVTQPQSSWRSVPVGEEELPKQQTPRWEPISNAPEGAVEGHTTKIEPVVTSVSTGPAEGVQTGIWRSVPVGEEELPKQQTSRWEPISNAPEGAVEEQTTKIQPVATSVSTGPAKAVQTGIWRSVPVGEEELPNQQTSGWQQISNAPAGETEVSEQPQPGSSSSSPDQGSIPSDLSQETSLVKQRMRSGRRMNTIPILQENSVMSPNGSFSYSYKSGNGIQVEESGHLTKGTAQEGTNESGGVPTVRGSYSYTAPDGRLISVRYVADQGGFQPEVEDLPTER